MKLTHVLSLSALTLAFSLLSRLHAQPQMVLLHDDAESGRRVGWSTEPGSGWGAEVDVERLRSDRFGYVWFARDGTGVWFWSETRKEWIGITPQGGLWSTAEKRFL